MGRCTSVTASRMTDAYGASTRKGCTDDRGLGSIGRVWALSDEQDGVMILYHACVHECSLLNGHVVFLELLIQGIQKNLRHAWCFAV